MKKILTTLLVFTSLFSLHSLGQAKKPVFVDICQHGDSLLPMNEGGTAAKNPLDARCNLGANSSLDFFAIDGSKIVSYSLDFPPDMVNSSSTINNGNEIFQPLGLMPAGTVIKTITFFQVVKGVYTTNSSSKIKLALFSDSGTGTMTLVDSTVNDTTLFKGTANTYISKDLSSNYTTVAGVAYRVGVIFNVVSISTAPTFASRSSLTGISPVDLTNNAKLYGSIPSKTDLDSSVSMSSVSAGTVQIYFEVKKP